ncbi:MAG: hypothetical protein NTZ79_03485 [Proteobacteria bacterium]|nr:hypothetical protein [Pseudomonadota bacterium]
MPTRFLRDALPLPLGQGSRLRSRKQRIKRRVIRVIAVNGIECLAHAQKPLAVDEGGYGIRIQLASRPAPALREPLGLLEDFIRNRNRGFHITSITVVIPLRKTWDVAPAPTKARGIAGDFLGKHRVRRDGRLLGHPRATQGNAESNRRDRQSINTSHSTIVLCAISLPDVALGESGF